MESVTEREDEVVIYVKINDFEGLKKAQSKESHEQWQVKAPFGTIRVRKTSTGDLEPQYSMAIKTRDNNAGIQGGTETPVNITQDVFEAFKQIADNGMIKDRYCFAPTKTTIKDDSGKKNIADSELIYEVDVYPDGNGGYHPYAKIDVEINGLLDKAKETSPNVTTANLTISVSDLPFKPSEPIVGNTDNPEEKVKITRLYDQYFLTKKTIEQTGASQESETLETTNNESPEATANTEEALPTEEVVETGQEATVETPQEDEETAKPTGGMVRVVESTPKDLYGKSIPGRQSGYIVSYEYNGKTYEIELDTGIRGKDIPVTVTYSHDGVPSVSIK